MRARIDKILGWILAILMAVMTLDVIWGVFTRYVMGAQASWSEELARYLLIWIGVLGAGYAAGQKLHLAIDLLPSRLEGTPKRNLNRLISGLVLFFVLVVFVIGGARLVYITWYLGQTSAALQIPLAVVYAIIPLTGILVLYYKLADLLSPDTEITE
jgi:TRAP-type C4-dicarboxylate transport system permease small subunit